MPTFHDPINSQWEFNQFLPFPLAECQENHVTEVKWVGI